MSEKISTILEEISQLCLQYKAEVPGRRRAWPRSIKDRVLALRRLGVSYVKIAQGSGLSAATLYSWKLEQKGASFMPVKVTAKSTPTVTVGASAERERVSPTVTVITPSGFRIEGLCALDITELVFCIERRMAGAR